MIFYLSCFLSILPLIYYFFYPQVNLKSKKNGGELVADFFKKNNIKYIFTLIGGHISPIITESNKKNIKVIDVRHEVNAVFAADACGRLSNKPGIAIVTAGPGVTNTITAIQNAKMAESPLILIGGASATLLQGKGSLQDIDQISLMKTVCKTVYKCKKVNQIIPILEKAYINSMTNIPGPVFVEIPIDLLYNIKTVLKQSVPKIKKFNLFACIVDIYIKYKVYNLFHNAWVYQPKKIILNEIKQCNNNVIKKTIKLLNKSKKPIIIIGSQIMQYKHYINDIKIYLDKLKIPFYLTSCSRGLVGKNNKYQIRHKRKDTLRNADLIILLGVTCDFRLNYGKSLNKNAYIISINHNKKSLYLNHNLFWKGSILSNSSIVNYLKDISIEYTFKNLNWLNELKERDNKRDDEIILLGNKNYKNLANPIKLLIKLEKSIPNDSIIILDGGDFAATSAYILKPDGPLQWLDPGPFGTLGVGAGFALGARMCFPKKPIWIIYGDGACGYSLIEYDTFSRFNLNINCLIGNDACWTQIEREQIPLLGSDTGCKLDFSDYHKFANVVNNTNGILINKDNIDDLDNIVINKSNIINALIAKTNFRKGSISV